MAVDRAVERERVVLRDRRGAAAALRSLDVPSELRDRGKPRTAIVLTAPWHGRAGGLVEQLRRAGHTPLPDSAQFLVDTYGSPPSSGDGGPDVVWLLREERRARPYSSGDRLRLVPTCSTDADDDTVLWVERGW
jgi:hypothetical protein